MKEDDRQTRPKTMELYHDLGMFSIQNDLLGNFSSNLNLENNLLSNLKMDECFDYQVQLSANDGEMEDVCSLHQHSKSYGDYQTLSEANEILRPYSNDDIKSLDKSNQIMLDENKFFSSDHIMLDYELSLIETPVGLEEKLPDHCSSEGHIPKKKYISKKRRENPVKKLIRLIENEKIDPYLNTEYLNKFISQEQIYDEKVEQSVKSIPKFAISNSLVVPSNKPCCSCQKSYCVKIYCSCFKKRKYCIDCNCKGCLNRSTFSFIRDQTIKHLEWKYNSAILPDSSNLSEHYPTSKVNMKEKSCNCKHSSCRKNYCICFQNGRICTELCKCINCFNV